MELREICSTIASNHLKVGDVVECVRSKTRGPYDSCSVGKQYTISKIEESDIFENFKYLIFKEKKLGHFSHFFKKVDK